MGVASHDVVDAVDGHPRQGRRPRPEEALHHVHPVPTDVVLDAACWDRDEKALLSGLSALGTPLPRTLILLRATLHPDLPGSPPSPFLSPPWSVPGSSLFGCVWWWGP